MVEVMLSFPSHTWPAKRQRHGPDREPRSDKKNNALFELTAATLAVAVGKKPKRAEMWEQQQPSASGSYFLYIIKQ